MPNAYTRYVTWISRGRRHHGSAAAAIVTPPPPSVMAQGDTFQAPWAPPTISWVDDTGTHSANFAFWSVTGGTGGAFVSALNTPPPAQVGSGDIVATAWYIAGGGNGGPPGVSIDAFDVNMGNFVDDDFVTVSPDNTLTAAANNDGFVPTASQEHVNAFGSIHSVPFVNWTVIAGTETVNAGDLLATARSSAIAFAFYQTPNLPRLNVPRVPEDSTWVSWGVMVDGGGPTGRGPVPPWNPFVLQFAAGLALADSARNVSSELRSHVLDLAAKQVSIAADAIQKALRAGKKEG
jgi:hypothetical protein